MLAVAALVQVAAWTAQPVNPAIGDTVRIMNTIDIEEGVRLRVGQLVPTELVEPLGPPEVTYREGTASVRYFVALFLPGEQTVHLPAVELLSSDGTSGFLPADSVVLQVRSALLEAEGGAEPRPGLDPLRRRVITPVPLVVLLTIIVGSALLWWYARSRPPPPDSESEPVRVAPRAPIAEWVQLGELRAAASIVRERLVRGLRAVVPELSLTQSSDECIDLLRESETPVPVRQIEEVFRELDQLRFAPATGADVLDLEARVEELIRQSGEAE